MQKEAKKILNKKVISGADMGRAILLNVVASITADRMPLFTYEELDALAKRMRTTNKDLSDSEPYFRLNSLLPDLDSYMNELLNRVTAFTVLFSIQLHEYIYSEQILDFYNRAPLYLGFEELARLQQKYGERQKDKELDFSDIVYIALTHYLPKTVEELDLFILERLDTLHRKPKKGMRAIPAAIARGFFNDVARKIDKEEAAILMPLILRKAKSSKFYGETFNNKVVKPLAESMAEYHLDSIRGKNPQDTASVIAKHAKQYTALEEELKAKYAIDLADEYLSSLEGSPKSDFLDMPYCRLDLTKLFFSGEDEEEKAESYAAFKRVYPNLSKALIADIKKNLPEVKGSEINPTKPLLKMSRLLNEGLYNAHKFLIPQPEDLIDLLPAKDRRRAIEYGICSMILETGNSSFNSKTLSATGAKQIETINRIYEIAELKSVTNSLGAEKVINHLEGLLDDFKQDLSLLDGYNYFIGEFKAAQKIAEIELLKVDTEQAKATLLECNYLIDEVIHLLSFSSNERALKIFTETVGYFDIEEFQPNETQKARLKALAHNIVALGATSLITSIITAMHL